MDYNFNYTTVASNGATIDVSLVLTLGSMRNSDGSFQIEQITGEWNHQQVLGLITGDGTNYPTFDNEFFPNDQNGTNSSNGVGFTTFSGFGFAVDTTGPNAITGDDGQGNVNFGSGGGTGGNGDGEVINDPNTGYSYAPASSEAASPACFCTGTLIRTPGGDVAVERLDVGDLVVTQDGTPQPILWIGRRSYAGRFLAGRAELYPVRIKAAALAVGVPSRDLLVSQKHAMYLDGLLVSAVDLVNGVTITIDRGFRRVDYLHIELASHAIVWAEDAASETFVDDDSRGVFHNASDYTGPEADGPALYCAPRVTQGYQLEAIRRALPLPGQLALVA